MDKGYYEINQMHKNYPFKVVPHENILKTGSYVAQHWHRSVEIVLSRGDGFKLWVNGITRTMNHNDLAIINHGEFHSFMEFKGGNQSGCSVLVSYTLLKEINPAIDYVWFETGKKETANEQLREAILKIRETYQAAGEWYNLRLRSAAYEMLYLLFTEYMLDKNSSHIKSMKSGETYKEIVNYITEQYHENIKLKDVAA